MDMGVSYKPAKTACQKILRRLGNMHLCKNLGHANLRSPFDMLHKIALARGGAARACGCASGGWGGGTHAEFNGEQDARIHFINRLTVNKITTFKVC